MKRFFLYLLAITLLPQVISADVLVGKTDGAFSVSPTGAATYTIPIKVQSGLSDFSPSISLAYSSQSGNGIAGVGFGISGLSSISIAPRNRYFDTNAEAIKEGGDNAFTLDGQRLLLKEGQNGQTGAVYRTENEQYNIISITASQNGTPATFQVKATNGITYKYGSSTGRQTQSNGKAYQWALDYAEDALGNYIQYTYSQEGVLYPTSITYGRNIHGTAGVDCTVSFTYENRPDSIPVYMFGEQRFLKKRLKSIVCKYDGNVYRTYTLNYTEDVFSHLTSVSETGTGSASVPPTTFEWEVPSEFRLDCSSRNMDMHERRDSDIVRFFSDDLDGDGISEVISVETDNRIDYNNPTTLFYVRKYNPRTQTFEYSNFYHLESHCCDLLHGTFSVHASYKQGNSLVLPYYRRYPNSSVTISNEMHFVFPEYDKNKNEFGVRMKGKSTDNKKNPVYTFLDSDLDGLDNIFIVEKETVKVNKKNVYPAYLVTFKMPKNSHSASELYLDLDGVPELIRPADFNADGMVDLLITTSEGYYIYWNRNGSFSDKYRYYSTAFNKCDIIQLGDFNGDGLVDLIINKHDSNQWYIARNTGNTANGYFSLSTISDLVAKDVRMFDDDDKRDKTYCLVQDIDGDGKSDAIVGYPYRNKDGGSLCILKSNGNTLVLTDWPHLPNSGDFPNFNHIFQGFFDGQGGAQILYKGKSLEQNTVGWHILDNPTIKKSSQKIISVTDGLGAKDDISYGLLTDNDVYQVNDNSSLPESVIRMTSPMPVVKTRTEVIPTDSRTTDYSYANGLTHLQGKGFLGFKDIKATSSTGMVTESHSELVDSFLVLMPCSSINRNVTGDVISQEVNRTSLKGVGAHSYTTDKSYRQSDLLMDGFFVREKSEDYKYGSPTKQMKADSLFRNDQTITYWNSPLSNVWIKGLPSTVEITKRGEGPDSWTTGDDIHEKTTYERDNATGLVLREVKRRNGQIISTDGYTYNEYGQVTQHYTVAYGSTDTLVTRYEYNAKGQLSKEYEPKGLYKRYTYNSSNGTLASVYGFDGVTTRYTYDGLLRETSRKRATIETCQTTRALSSYGGGVYSIKEAVTGKTSVTTYYDAWERKIAESAPLANGTAMYTDYQYLSNGQLGFVSFPHKKNEPTSEGTTYTYDSAFRKTSAVDSNGKSSTWSYSPMQITSCIDGVTTTTSYYTEGKVSEVEDAAGWVHYDYNADGNISFISGNVGEAVYEYDEYGRLAQTTDMNGVVKQYEYDVNGNPSKITIGDSYVETNYDKYGILRSKSWADSGESPHTVTYQYDNKYRLTQERGEGYMKSYGYDTYGRIRSKYHYIPDGQAPGFDISYQYGSDNNVSKTTRSFSGYLDISPEVIEEYTYNNGYRITDVLNDTLVCQLTKQDKWGNITEEWDFLGSTEHTYDDYGNMLSFVRDAVADARESYTYNIHTGNMISKNGIRITYDNMNRLTGYGSETYSYDRMGNLTRQPRVGNFSYNGFKVDKMTPAGINFLDGDLHISYYKAIERPKSIENDRFKAEFYYDGNGDRYMMKVYEKISGTPTLSFTRYYYDADVEITVDSRGYHTHHIYAGGDAYTAPAVLIMSINENDCENYSSCIYQITRDNIGSAILYANANYDCYQNSYSPWGVRTYKVGNNTYFYQPGEEPGYGPFYRTYTGHEDLWMFGLINANARLYSPYLGRFVSPDPLLNSEGGPLLYNPYVYANNNPFKYIDRNGEFVWLVPAIFGGFAAAAVTSYYSENVLKSIGSFVCGAVATGLSIGVGVYVGAAVTAGCASVGAVGVAPFVGAAAGAAASYLTYNLSYSALTGTPFNFSWKDMGIEMGIAVATVGVCTVASKLAPKASKIMQTRHRPTAKEPDLILPEASEKAPINSQPDPADVLEQARIQAGQGNSTVYVGVDENNVIKYVGRTDRPLEMRAAEHLRDVSKKSIIVKFKPVKTTLDHNGSRVAEQILINKYGLQKNGGQLINKINSISPKHWEKFGIPGK